MSTNLTSPLIASIATTSTKNVGEWTEKLVVLYCLCNPMVNIDGSNHTIKAISFNGVTMVVSLINKEEISSAAESIFKTIRSRTTGSGGSFSITNLSTNKTLNELGIGHSTKHYPHDKEDITLIFDGRELPLSFNIKSLLGDNPSIVNPSKQTSLRYRLINPKLSLKAFNAKLPTLSLSKKIEFLKNNSENIITEPESSDIYFTRINELHPDALKDIGNWLLLYYHNNLQPHHLKDTTTWFGNFIIKSMIGASPAKECGIAFAYNVKNVFKVNFTRADQSEYIRKLCSHIKFSKPSYKRHYKYMLSTIGEEFCFRLPIQIRLRSTVKDLFNESK